MPWQSHWVPAPRNPHLPVHPDPPEGSTPWLSLGGPDEVRAPGHRAFYRCRHCQGWIEGHPHESRVNTLAPLSGRRGMEFYCIRCGQEIGFSGMMS